MHSALTGENRLTGQQSLEKTIRENAEKKQKADAEKYTQLAALAGDRKNELEKRRGDVTGTHKKWHDLKTALTASPNKANPDHFKAVEMAAQAYSTAHKAFIDLQKAILTSASVPVEDHSAFLVVMR